MKLYEVNQQLENLILHLEPDPETGEIPANEDEIIAQINALAMKREDILQYLAKLALDAKATVQSLKAEEKRLKERRQRMDNRHDRLVAILDRECGGEKTELGVATLCYRKTSHVEITYKGAALFWLKEMGHEDCIRIPEPEISKQAVGKLLDAGVEVDGVEQVTGTSCYLR